MHLGEISDRSPVGVVDNILEIIIGLLLGGTADDAHGRPHLDVATTLTRQSLGLGDAAGTGLWCFDRVEMHIRVVDGEPASGLGAAGVHHQRVCVIEGPWRTFHAVELVVRPLVIEPVFAGPDPLDDAPPLFALSVAGVVLLLGHPKHLELVLVPAADDVHAEASLANVVRRGHLLGRHEGMMQGNVDRAEHVEAPRRGQQATRPGNRFETGPVGVGLASVALPPRDGHHALDPDLVRHLRQLEVVLPARLPALGERGIRSPARAIGAEEPEPEAIAVHENGIALSHPSSPSPPLHITHAAGGRIALSHDVYEAGASTVSDSIRPARLAPFRRFALLDQTRSAMFKTYEQKGGRQDMASVALRSSRSFSYPTASESSALAFAL